MTDQLSTLAVIAQRAFALLSGLPLGDWISRAWQVYQSNRFRGLYRVMDHRVTLRLCDAHGRKAIHEKVQGVVFLRDDVFAVQDQAWGDGNIFADYVCSPGVAVDRYKEGFRWKVLISLRSTKHAGDSEILRVRRVISNGFKTPTGNFHTQIDHPHDSLSIGVIFPPNRLPRTVSMIEQNSRVTHVLANDDVHILPDGNIEYRWETESVRLYEAYIMRWEW